MQQWVLASIACLSICWLRCRVVYPLGTPRGQVAAIARVGTAGVHACCDHQPWGVIQGFPTVEITANFSLQVAAGAHACQPWVDVQHALQPGPSVLLNVAGGQCGARGRRGWSVGSHGLPEWRLHTQGGEGHILVRRGSFGGTVRVYITPTYQPGATGPTGALPRISFTYAMGGIIQAYVTAT